MDFLIQWNTWSAVARWVRCRTANQVVRVQFSAKCGFDGLEPTKISRPENRGPAPWRGDQTTGKCLGFDSWDRSHAGNGGHWRRSS